MKRTIRTLAAAAMAGAIAISVTPAADAQTVSLARVDQGAATRDLITFDAESGLPLGRLADLVRDRGTAAPQVLFVCVQNAGRSQLAAAIDVVLVVKRRTDGTRYLQQIGVPFSQAYIEQTFARHPLLARLIAIERELRAIRAAHRRADPPGSG